MITNESASLWFKTLLHTTEITNPCMKALGKKVGQAKKKKVIRTSLKNHNGEEEIDAKIKEHVC